MVALRGSAARTYTLREYIRKGILYNGGIEYILFGMPKVRLWGFECTRCGHQWLPRSKEKPCVCPGCKSPYWDRPRRTALAAGQSTSAKRVTNAKG
jgi:hypothetical protein